MELWFIYALLSAVGAGLFTFGFKFVAERDLNANSLTGVYMLVAAILSGVMWLVVEGFSMPDPLHVVLIAFSGMMLSFLYLLQIPGLKCIDTAIFYPLYKTLSPLIVIVGAVILIGEELTRVEYIALGISLLTPLMLITKGEKVRQNDLAKGILILLLCSAIAAGLVILAKWILDQGASVLLFIAIQSAFGFLTNLVIGYIKNNPIHLSNLDRQHIVAGGCLGLLLFLFNVAALQAFKEGLASIVYTVQSFYILIPIVLSVIIYHEHMNLRKGIAIGLSILAIIFFQI